MNLSMNHSLRRIGSALALLILLLLPCARSETEIVRIAVLDSGCNSPNAVGVNVLDDSTNLTDAVGHGTKLDGILAELVPEAERVTIKCFEDRRNADGAILAKGLRAAVNDWNADIVVMSFASPVEDEDLHAAVREATERGVLLLASAGNLSMETGLGCAVYPASWNEVIGIGGVDVSEDGEVTASLWYLRGTAVSFCADGDGGDEKGASFAVPRAAALCARLLLEGAAPADVVPRLQQMAQDLGAPGYDTTYGWGYLEVLPEGQ